MKKKIIAMFLALCLLFGIFSSLSLAQTTIGDVNSDGNINGKDVLMLRKYIVRLVSEDDVDINACDVNSDDNINGKDVLMLRKYIIGLVKEFPTTTVVTTTETTTETTTQASGEWVTMYDFENETDQAMPSYVSLGNSQNAVVSQLGSSYKFSNTLNTSSTKGLLYSSTSTKCNPVYDAADRTAIKTDKTALASASDLRMTLHIAPSNYYARVYYIGITLSAKTYYVVLTEENYSEYGRFYFVGTEFKIVNSKETYTLTKDDISKINRIQFWAEGTGAKLLIDDIEYYTGASGYDSSAEIAALPQPDYSGEGGYICLSYDDGPTVSNMNKLLDLCESEDIPMTFFLIGQNIKDTDDVRNVMKRALDLGCEFGNHTYTHSDLTKLTKEKVEEELTKTDDLIYQLSGVTTDLLRPPYLATSSEMFENCNRICICGYCPEDWNGYSANLCFQRIRRNCGDGHVILLHDTTSICAELAELVIDYYKACGYEFVTVSEMFEIKGVTPSKTCRYDSIG